MPRATFMLQHQSWVAGTGSIWVAKLKTFIIWPFTEKACQPLYKVWERIGPMGAISLIPMFLIWIIDTNALTDGAEAGARSANRQVTWHQPSGMVTWFYLVPPCWAQHFFLSIFELIILYFEIFSQLFWMYRMMFSLIQQNIWVYNRLQGLQW